MRTLRERTLDTAAARLRLPVQSKPFWRLVQPSLHLGYRRLKKRPGSWIRRRYLGNEEYQQEWIAYADDYGPSDAQTVLTFAEAQERCRGRPTVKAGPYTIRDAVEEYLAWYETERKSGRDARRRAEALIIPQLGDQRCEALTAGALNLWRNNLAALPPRARTRKDAKQNYRKFNASDAEAVRARRATVNRLWGVLRAALNKAFRDGKISSDTAWRRVKPFKNVDKARADYLETAAATRLINSCSDPNFRSLVHAALETGMRFSELARLVAADFHAASGTVTVRQSKSGKTRHVVLTPEGAELFKRLVVGRNNGDLIFKTANGLPWKTTQQPMLAACRAARIVPAVSFHILRHTYCSLSVMGGMPLLILARNLGHSDERMVTQHYGHLSQSYLTDAIRAAAPRYNIEATDSVIAIR
jgi:integrase